MLPSGESFGPPNTSTSGCALRVRPTGPADRAAPSRRRRGTTATRPTRRRAGRCEPRPGSARNGADPRSGKRSRTACRDVGVAVGADEQLEPRRIDLCLQARQQASSRGMRRPVTMQIVTNGAASMPCAPCPGRPSQASVASTGRLLRRHGNIHPQFSGRQGGQPEFGATPDLLRRAAVGGPVGKLDMARRAVGMARGLRALVRDPVTVPAAEAVVTDEVARRGPRFLASLDRMVWPYPTSPTRRLLTHAGYEPADVARLVTDEGLVAALQQLRDAGVYVSYEEYHGRIDARRGSATFSFSPPDFFNPVQEADYLATTGGSRSTGTPVELSFAWQRRQGVQRAIQFDRAGVRGAPTAVWLPVFPSAAGFGAVMKTTAGGNRPERWFSQVPVDLEGISSHKQLANKFLPRCSTLAARTAVAGVRPHLGSRARRALARRRAAPERCRRAHRLRELAHGRGALGERAWHRARRRRRVPEQRARHGRKARGDAGRGHAAVPDVRIHSRRHDGPELRRVRRRGVPPLGPRARGRSPAGARGATTPK